MARESRPYGLKTLAIDAAVLALFWLFGFALVQAAQRLTNPWPASDIGQLIAEVVAFGVALRFRARIAAFLTASFSAFTLAELAIHGIFGIRAAQGGPTHFAVLTAAFIGVALGAFALAREQHGRDEHLTTAG
jgi:hypothetical protein